MKRRVNGSLLISIALHVVLGAALVWVLSFPPPLRSWLHWSPQPHEPVEHMTYLAPVPPGPSTRGRSGGNGLPVSKRATRAAAPLTAPITVPTGVPTAPSGAAPGEGGTGPIVGNGGAQEGIVPSYNDPRVWLPPGPVYLPRTQSERLDSAIASRIQQHIDSLNAYAASQGRAPGDWTIDKNGKKYGIDQHKIYFGSFSIPSAILALLPIHSGGNPILAQQDQALAFQRSEIQAQAQRAMNDAEFREAVKQIRERMQREHDAEKKRREEEKKKKEKAQEKNEIAQP